MAKFKVGDKVRVKSNLDGCFGVSWTMLNNRGNVMTISLYDATEHMQYKIEEDRLNLWWDESVFEPVAKREFIVIRRSGAETIAELRHDREVIKSAKATCAPSDTFDLDTGAKLAFDRLMGREEPKPAPQPAHRFKVGDRVVVEEYNEIGEVSAIDANDNSVPYLVFHASGCHSGGCYVEPSKPEHAEKCSWFSEGMLSPDPEPPKFYTGKVFAEKIIESDARERMRNRIGRVFEIKNGIIQGEVKQYDLDDYEPIVSFSDFCLKAKSTKWHEVKYDV